MIFVYFIFQKVPQKNTNTFFSNPLQIFSISFSLSLCITPCVCAVCEPNYTIVNISRTRTVGYCVSLTRRSIRQNKLLLFDFWWFSDSSYPNIFISIRFINFLCRNLSRYIISFCMILCCRVRSIESDYLFLRKLVWKFTIDRVVF